jgi:hypothetical protein
MSPGHFRVFGALAVPGCFLARVNNPRMTFWPAGHSASPRRGHSRSTAITLLPGLRSRRRGFFSRPAGLTAKHLAHQRTIDASVEAFQAALTRIGPRSRRCVSSRIASKPHRILKKANNAKLLGIYVGPGNSKNRRNSWLDDPLKPAPRTEIDWPCATAGSRAVIEVTAARFGYSRPAAPRFCRTGRSSAGSARP